MRNWNYDNWGMMGGNFQWVQLWGLLTWIALFLFLVLGSIYFWKQIKKNKK